MSLIFTKSDKPLIALNFALICNYTSLSNEQLFFKPQLRLIICVTIPGLIKNDKNLKNPESFRAQLIKFAVML
jgi:hypothetical protein